MQSSDSRLDRLLNEISHDPYLVSVSNHLSSAWIGHAPFIKFLIREQKPKLFVELGVHNGFSYFVGCQSIRECNLNSKAYGVDHWAGDSQAGFYDERVYHQVTSLNLHFSDFSTLLKMSFQEAIAFFEDRTIDLLHIDGFHSYEAVKEDFETWLPKMSSNGIIILHDIHVRRNTFGVYKFWRELETKFETIEFVGSHGLGVVFLGQVPSGKLSELVQHSRAGRLNQIQGAFGSIADDVIQNSIRGDSLNALTERDNALTERDNALTERDNALTERDLISNSKIWRLFSPYRKLKRLFQRS